MLLQETTQAITKDKTLTINASEAQSVPACGDAWLDVGKRGIAELTNQTQRNRVKSDKASHINALETCETKQAEVIEQFIHNWQDAWIECPVEKISEAQESTLASTSLGLESLLSPTQTRGIERNETCSFASKRDDLVNAYETDKLDFIWQQEINIRQECACLATMRENEPTFPEYGGAEWPHPCESCDVPGCAGCEP